MAVLADGRLISASSDRTLRVWDPGTGDSLQTLEGHADGVEGVAVLADGRVVSASGDGTLRVWDLATGESLATFHVDVPVLCVAVDPDTRTIVGGDQSGRLHFLRFEKAE